MAKAEKSVSTLRGKSKSDWRTYRLQWRTCISLRPDSGYIWTGPQRDDRKLRFYSVNFSRLGVIESSLDDLIPSDQAGWTNYPKGVMWAFEKRNIKLEHGVDS